MVFAFIASILKSIFCFFVFYSIDFCVVSDQEVCEAIVISFANGNVVPSAALFLGTVPEGTVIMDTEGMAATETNTEMNLYDEAGVFLVNGDDGGTPSFLSRIERTLTPGSYVLVASEFSVIEPPPGSAPFAIGDGSTMFEADRTGTIDVRINEGVLSGSLDLGEAATTGLPEVGVYCFNVI